MLLEDYLGPTRLCDLTGLELNILRKLSTEIFGVSRIVTGVI